MMTYIFLRNRNQEQVFRLMRFMPYCSYENGLKIVDEIILLRFFIYKVDIMTPSAANQLIKMKAIIYESSINFDI